MRVRDLCMVRRAGVAVSVANVVFLWGLLACRTALFALAVSLCRLGTLWLRRDFLPLRGLLAVSCWRRRRDCGRTHQGACYIRRGCSGHEGGSSAGGRGWRAGEAVGNNDEEAEVDALRCVCVGTFAFFWDRPGRLLAAAVSPTVPARRGHSPHVFAPHFDVSWKSRAPPA